MEKGIKSVVADLRQKIDYASKNKLSAEELLPPIAGMLKLIEEMEISRTEPELKDEKQIKIILNTMIDGFYLVDTEGRILDTNESYCSMIGYRRDELLTMNVKDIEVLDSEEVIKGRIQQILETGYARFETKHLRKDGRIIDIEASANFLIEEKPKLFCFLRDITRRKELEESLRKQKEEFELIFDNIPAQIWYKDTLNNFVRVNRQVCADIGMTNDQIEGHSAEEIFPSFAEKFYQDDLEVINTGNPKRGIIEQINAAGGELRWVQTDKMPVKGKDGEIVHLIALVQDITEHKHTEERLRIQSEIMGQVNEAVYLVRMEDGIIVYTNSQFEKMFGYEHGEMLGKHVSIVNAPTEISPEETAGEIMESLAINGRWDGEVRNIRKDGTPFWSYAKVSVFEHSHFGKVFVDVHEDISEKKRMLEMLRESESELREAQQLSHVGSWTFDPESQQPIWSEEMFRIWGLDPENGAPPYCDHQKYIHPDDYTDFDEAVDKAVRYGTPYHLQLRICCPDGTEKTIICVCEPQCDAAGNIARLRGTVQDITELRKIGLALSENERMLRESQEIAQLGSFVWDLATNWWRSSDILNAIFGIDKSYNCSLEGWTNIVHPRWRGIVAYYLTNEVLGNHQPFDKEYQIIRQYDGQERWVHGLARLEFDSNRRPVKLIGTIRDVTARKRGEEMLRQQSDAMNASIDGLAILDADYQYIYLNKSHAQIYGYEVGELIRKSWRMLYTEDELQRFDREILPALSRKGYYSGRALGRKKNGSTFYQTISLTCLDNGGLICSVRDITDIHRMEEDLRESEDKFKYVFENSVIGKSITLISGVLQINKAFCKLLGYSSGEISGKKWQDITHPDDIEMTNEILENMLSGKRDADNFAKRYVKKDGAVIWAEISTALRRDQNGQPLYFVTTIADITQRKLAEDALKELNEFKNQVINSAQEGIVVYGRDQKYTVWNPYMENFSGLTASEVLGKHPMDFFPFLKASHVMDTINKALNGEICAPIEFPFIVPSTGKAGWASDTTGPLRNALGEIIGAISTVRNITESKKTEEALYNSETKLRTLVQAIPDLIWLKDKDGIYLSCNAMFERFCGARASEITGKTDYDFLERDLADSFREYDRLAIEAGKPTSNEEWITFADDGHRAYLETIKTPMYDSNGILVGVLGIGRDITNRKQAEVMLRESEEKLRKIMDQSSDFISITDDKGFITYASAASTSYFLFTPEEICGHHFTEILDDSIALKANGVFKDIVEQGRHSNADLTMKRKDGSTFVGNVIGSNFRSGEMNGVLVVIRDVTEHKKEKEELIRAKGKAEQSGLRLSQINKELEEKNVFIQTILDNLPIGLALNELSEGRAVYMNKKFEEVYGWSSEEITSIASFFEKVYPDPDYRKQMVERIMRDINSGDPGKMHWENICVTRKDGTNKVVNAVNIPLIKQNTMVSTVIDITALHMIQNDLVKAKEKAEESDRLKSAFLANMSHEIRTPMNGILGFAELLKEPKLTGEEQMDYINIIEQSGARMLNIINDIVSISKVEAGQMEVNNSETNINELIRYICSFFRPEAERSGLKLICKTPLPGKEAFVKTDKEKLYAILTNLIKNSLKFTKVGSIEIGYSMKGKFLEFFVKDTGKGISPEHKGIIFERFRQGSESLNRNYEGAGLGLSISKAYVELLGGEIGLESEQGRGSLFYFTLPNGIDQQDQDLEKNMLVDSVTECMDINLKILIAEDDKISERLLKAGTGKFSREFLTAGNGMDAIEICRNHPDIDLIFMDIQMPKMDGYEATKQIRQFNSDVIIIAQTAYALLGDKIKALDAGCNDYLSKPIDKRLLSELIDKYFKK